MERLANTLTFESVHQAVRGVPRSVTKRKPPASPCAEWPPVPGYPGGGSVRQAICEILHEVDVSREMLSSRA